MRSRAPEMKAFLLHRPRIAIRLVRKGRAAWWSVPSSSLGRTYPSQSCGWPPSARPARCRASRRRSLDRTHSGRSGSSAGTGLPAPQPTFDWTEPRSAWGGLPTFAQHVASARIAAPEAVARQSFHRLLNMNLKLSSTCALSCHRTPFQPFPLSSARKIGLRTPRIRTTCPRVGAPQIVKTLWTDARTRGSACLGRAREDGSVASRAQERARSAPPRRTERRLRRRPVRRCVGGCSG